jgi:hypothetical protein
MIVCILTLFEVLVMGFVLGAKVVGSFCPGLMSSQCMIILVS